MRAGTIDFDDDSAMVRLADQDRLALGQMAADRGITPSEWLAALIEARMRGGGCWSQQET